jgi:hypothetical protein
MSVFTTMLRKHRGLCIQNFSAAAGKFESSPRSLLLGNVAMHKQLAHTHARQQFGRHARIGAADEEKIRALALGHALEKLWVLGDRLGAPLFIVAQNLIN